MNPRFVLIASVVTIAGGAAAVRAWTGHSGAAAPAGIASIAGDGSGGGFVRDATPPPVRSPVEPSGALAFASLDNGGSRASGPTVYVVGAVRRAGVYRLAPGARIDAAIRRAGGVLPEADPVAVNFAQSLRDGEEIVVPVRGAPGATPAVDDATGADETATRTAASDLAEAGAPTAQPKRRHHRRHKRQRRPHRSSATLDGTRADDTGPATPGAAGNPAGAAVLDLNAATASELANLPGIGDGLAERIVTFRAVNGPFGRVEELLDVNGFSDRLYAEIEPYLTVAPRAVDPRP